MRRLALLAIVLSSAAATAASAQSFAARPGKLTEDPIGAVLDREAYAPGVGPVRWVTDEIQISRPSPSGPVDRLRVSVGGALRTPGGLPLNLDRAGFQPQVYEVSVIRVWPAALAFDAKAFVVDLSPHAGLGVTSDGGSAEAGATLRLSQRLSLATTERLKAMGLGDGAAFHDRGRWYLFAAASGRAVGLNMLRNDTGWDRGPWTTDATSSLVGDAQVGVGWRKGDLQTSLGYVHREMKGAHMLWGQETRQDSMVAFSLSIRPSR